MHHGKTAHRAGTEHQEGNTGNQRGDVGIDDGVPSVAGAFADGLLRAHSVAQFFADTLVNQHVGVDGHTERERNGRNAG